MTDSLKVKTDLEKELDSILTELSGEKEIKKFLDLRKKAESLAEKLPKERKLEWEDRIKQIKKPKLSKAERDKQRLERIKTSSISPAEALMKGNSNLDTVQTNKVKEDTPNVKEEDKPSNDQTKGYTAPSTIEQDTDNIKLNPEVDIEETVNDIEKSKKKGLAKLRSKSKKAKVEDTHTRKTYLVRNDLLDRIEDVSNGTHGFKIEFINFAIELGLAEYENMEDE